MHIPGTHRTMRYLSTVIILGDRRNCLTLQQHVKATGLPLTAESAHHPCQSTGWQRNMLAKACEIATTSRLKTSACDEITHWLRTGLIDECAINEWLASTSRQRIKRVAAKEERLWLSVPWHPAYRFKNPLRQAIADANNRSELLRRAFGYTFQLGIAWRKPGPSVQQIFEQQDKQRGSEGRG